MKYTILAIGCLFLAHCAKLPQNALNQKMRWQDRQAELSKIKHFKLNGGVAFASHQKSFSASANWAQTSPHIYTVNLFGPLGFGAVTIQSKPSGVIIQTSDNKTLKGTSASQLLQKTMGWQLPFDRLYYWLRGLPAPNSRAKKQFDAYHHLSALTSKNWHVEYLSYMNANGIDLPHKIRLITPFYRAVVVINGWSF